jgi:flagellar biosynthesis component FlhA
VLRGLVGEKVPITAFQAIVESVEQRKGEANVSSLINEVRMQPEVRKDLPGNRNIAHRFRLSARIEDELQDAVYEESGQSVLALPPDNLLKIDAAVRNRVRDRPDEAIIVAKPGLRPLVSKLVKAMCSNTSVMSQDEMLDTYGNALRKAQEIDFG